MPVPPPNRPNRRFRVVLSSTALVSFMSVRKAAALAVAQLGVAAFFIAGVTRAALGRIRRMVRAGGRGVWRRSCARSTSRVGRCSSLAVSSVACVTPSAPPASSAAATGLVERLLLAALASVVAGHYASGVAVTAIAGWRLTGHVRPEDFATMLGVALIGLLWIRARIGLDLGPTRSREASGSASGCSR